VAFQVVLKKAREIFSTMSATPSWEQSKENAAPLERGRNVASLGARLSQAELKARLHQYEETIRPTEALNVKEMEGDPLIHWLAYIKFYQNAFPADTRDNFLLMERCVRALVKMKQYSNDDRFVGVCAKYADKTKDPSQVFKYLHQQKVGTYTALFWIAWAFIAEKDGDFAFAENIFKKGISKQAQPLQMLKVRHSQFQRRMSRHWLNSSKSNHSNLDEYDQDDDERNRPRSALGGLSRDRSRQNDGERSDSRHPRSRQHGLASGLFDRTNQQRHLQQQQQQKSVGSFSIFVDQVNEDGYDLDQSFADRERRVIAKDTERKKENNQHAEQWNQRGGLQSSIQPSRMPFAKDPSASFPVFVDEDCAVENERKEGEERRYLDRQRQVRDDRAFRERKTEGIVSAFFKCVS
jgi:hypothetical protein